MKNDNNFIESLSNNNITKCALKLNREEITLQIAKLPEHKMKLGLNTSGLLSEEIEVLNNDSKGSAAYFKTVHNAAKKFFMTLMSSDQERLIPFAEIVLDSNRNETHYVHMCFKGKRCPTKKERLNNCLRYFALENKKVQCRKKDLNKFHKDKCDSITHSTICKMLFSYFRFFGIPCA